MVIIHGLSDAALELKYDVGSVIRWGKKGRAEGRTSATTRADIEDGEVLSQVMHATRATLRMRGGRIKPSRG